MAFKFLASIPLPPNTGNSGFDHADVYAPHDRLYVAHTCNDAVDIIDCAQLSYVESVAGFCRVAGVLASDARELVFTSNRGDNTVTLFTPGAEQRAFTLGVGVAPNGLAFDPERGLLLVANVGDPAIPNSHTVSLVDIETRQFIADVNVPGRTRWAVYDPKRGLFYVNIASPACIVAIDARKPFAIVKEYAVPAQGPHGLDIDLVNDRLFCACDDGKLMVIDLASGLTVAQLALSGAPDVIFLNPALASLYVAVGDPGVIDVIDTSTMRRAEVVATEQGAHTLALDRKRNRLFAFLPQSHRAMVFDCAS
jgi:DNA-binding beta-propeller fold protein YncE